MSKQRIVETVARGVTFTITEDSSTVDGEHVLAEIEGEFFVPDGMSRNGRFYPKSLWERVCSSNEIKRRLKDKLMFGTVGHDAPLGDAAIREGTVSHIVTEINITEDNKGIGKALILGTPAGRILNTVIRAGSKLAVSSRANGTFKGKHQGKPVVDEDTYELEGWDFVVDPGFLEAKPELKESLQEIQNSNNIEKDYEGESKMDADVNKTLVEHIANENADLKTKVGNLTDEVTNLTEANKVLEDENAHVKTQLEKLEVAEKKIEAFEELGTFEQVKEALEIADKQTDVLNAFYEMADTPEDAKTAFEAAENFINNVNKTFGSVTKGKKALETLAAFEGLGTFEQVKTVLEAFDAKLEEEAEEKKAVKVAELAKVIGKDEEFTKNLMEKYTEEDILALHTSVASEDSPYKKKNEENEEELASDVNDEVSENTTVSLAEKIGASLVGNL